MTLEGVGITQPQNHGPFQIRLKFGKQAYYVIARTAEAPCGLLSLLSAVRFGVRRSKSVENRVGFAFGVFLHPIADPH